MAVVVGTLQINVAAKTAAFTADINRLASDSASKMSSLTSIFDTFGESSSRSVGEASKSLRLLGEEAGVHVPREIANLLAGFGPIQGVINAAFSGIAIFAIIELIVKATEQIEKFRAKAQESQAAWDKLGDEGQKALQKLDDELLSLQIQLEKVTHQNAAALRDEIREIDRQTLENIVAQFQKLSDVANDAFKQMTVSSTASFFGMGNNEAVRNAQNDLAGLIAQVNKLAAAGNNAQIGQLLQQKADEIKSFKDIAFENDDHPEIRQQALEHELTTIQLMAVAYQKLDAVDVAKKKLVEAEAVDKAKKAWQEYGDFMLRVRQMQGKMQPVDVPLPTQIAGDISQDKVMQQLVSGINPSALYGGSAQAMAMEKVKTDQAFAIQQAQQIKTSLMSENDQWNQQLAIMKQLEQQGLLTGADLTKAINQHQSALDQAKKNWSQLGGMIGNTLEQALLFGGNWKKALQSTLIDVAELILKMTLLKNLQASTGQGGATGFFSSLVSGLLNKHAAGGSIPAGQWGIVGDAGPEAVYGGQTGMTVVPNYKREQPTAPQQSSGQSQPVHTHYHSNMTVHTPDANSFGKSQTQLADEADRQMRIHAARNGGRR